MKRLALLWGQALGYAITATEVSLPNLQFRIDVAGYKPATALEATSLKRQRRVPCVGTTVIFECKQARPDYVRDARCANKMLERLAKLEERKKLQEDLLRIHCPSLRNGDSLFAEYETCAFHRAGYEPYEKLIREMSCISQRLHRETKFEKLIRWQAANLHYVVAEPGLIEAHELPAGWGLLVRTDHRLNLVVKPFWHDIPEPNRLLFLQRIGQAATRFSNREHDIAYEQVAELRRGTAAS